MSGEQIYIQQLSKDDLNAESGVCVPNKNQTGFFPTLQRTNVNQNGKLIISDNEMKSKIISHGEVELNIDLTNN